MTPAEEKRAKAAARSRAWRKRHPAKQRSNSSKWHEANRERSRENNRRWRAANRDHVRATQRAWRERTDYGKSPSRLAQTRKDSLRRYGLSEADYDALLAAQGGVCAVCGSQQPRVKGARRLYVDHCHQTQRVRGLLCGRCNSMIGFADESADRLRAALHYLETTA